ncbi:HTH_Tnp_Tc3_2 domain-containing protein [Trichonephila clavipes]|nr:HTH_Tnp_Tc3_2 domain-containing protein [Trichonephila clavipes]
MESATSTRYHQENTIERHRYGGARWRVWGGIILGSRADLHVQSVTMAIHIYRDVILEQPDLNPIEHVWDMLGRRIAAHQPPSTCLPELRRALLDEWCNIPQDQIDNLILSMPRRYDFMRGRIIGKIEEGRKITDVAREFDIAHSVVSRLWKSFKTTGMCSRRHGEVVLEVRRLQKTDISSYQHKGKGAPQLSR